MRGLLVAWLRPEGLRLDWEREANLDEAGMSLRWGWEEATRGAGLV